MCSRVQVATCAEKEDDELSKVRLLSPQLHATYIHQIRSKLCIQVFWIQFVN